MGVGMKLTKISEVKQMANEAMALFDWSAIPLGHPIRNHAYSYGSWGIVITPDNIEALRQLSKEEYAKEWVPTDESLNHLIGIASERAGLSDTNMLLNEKIGEYSAEHILSLKHEAPRIIEIGTGAGGTILSVLNSMIRAGVDLSKLDITLVEPSQLRLDFAQDKITQLLQMNGVTLPKMRVLRGTVDALDQIETDFAHLVFQNAAIHHESFTDHLTNIYRVLKPEMPFISGDWHEGSYETPARIYWIYAMLQDPLDDSVSSRVLSFTEGKSKFVQQKERPGLQEFRRMFSLDDLTLAHAFDNYSSSERKANVGGMRYWLEVAKILEEKGKRSSEVLIQAHERVTPRVTALKNAGFCFDAESRRKYVEVIKAKGFGELGAVMVSKKRAESSRSIRG
jgi:SAM-dependent methyltransferase